MEQKLGDQTFAYNLASQSSMGYAFNITRLQYYISEIKLIHNGGQITPVTDLYFLVDPAVMSEFELGNFPVTNLEQIQFSVGVDPAHNHLDPSTYPNGHPLAPQSPSMHWGWSSGYRYIALEGFAGANSNELFNNYQIHTVGDANYRTVSIPVAGEMDGDNMAIHLQADYTHLLDAINVSGGTISHSANGVSKKISENARDFVFSPAEITGIVEPGISGTFQISPNPSNGETTIHYDLPKFSQLNLIVTDLTGRTVMNKEMEVSKNSFTFNFNWNSGIYIARIMSGDKLLAIEKLVIQ